MISNMFQNSKATSLPRDVKEAVQVCRKVTQDALANRISRMDVEFPVGTQFGVEARSKQKKQDKPTPQSLATSDRELARIFVEMFQPVGGENMVVAFSTADDAQKAKRKWKDDASAACRILSLDNKKSVKKKTKSKGFAAKMASEIDDSNGPFALPKGTEVAIFVAPTSIKEMATVERICSEVGMETLVILLNARLGLEDEHGLDDDFTTVFRLTAAPQDAAPGCLVFSAYKSPWLLARKAAVGPPKTVLSQETRFSKADCQSAYDTLELSDMERNVENAMENVANWFR